MKTMKTTNVGSMTAVMGFGAAAKSAARKLADKTRVSVLCRPARGTVREIRPGGTWSQVEFSGDNILDDAGEKVNTTGKGLLFRYTSIAAVRRFALGE